MVIAVAVAVKAALTIFGEGFKGSGRLIRGGVTGRGMLIKGGEVCGGRLTGGSDGGLIKS